MISLYRHYGHDSKLLYVGISNNALSRLYQHEQSSEWYELISRVEIEHYPSREQALKAEKKAIENEKPIYNFVHNSDSVKRTAQKKQKITEADVAKYRLVVAEREDILKLYDKRWGIDWLADHFGTTPEIIKFVIDNRYRRPVRSISD
ncbi:MAG: GIY-YIG nuclease family protein [Desulfuromonadaceae bacterium]|nr:GIY-YIG nuclease family protein [Desulfuromonadaceae bacterium]MDD2848507.1 GIY-YIG nuclease family protein [Desulfuromonadaceae bacterium]MDD4129864.1 GIY-YIG nuclease family protein [Desulfuromonadaceae bacterium]